MEDRVPMKVVPVGGRKYKIMKMEPRAAVWLFSVMGSRVSKSGSILGALGHLSLEEHTSVQQQSLLKAERITEVDGEVKTHPVLSASGTIADPDLELDPFQLFEVLQEVIQFNLGPFIEGLASRSQEVSR